LNTLPLGSGALAGSTVNLDRAFICKDLGFADYTENSLDAVSDRSFILEVLFILSALTLDFSRYAEDFIIFSSYEFSFFILSDTISTSSSLMPQKRNPDYLELIRGSAGKIAGYYQEMFLILKGLPFTYNKDLQGDKIPLKLGIERTSEIMEVFDIILHEIQINTRAAQEKINDYLYATDLVDYLTDKGIPFREAYGIVSDIVKFTEEHTKKLSSLTIEEYQKFNKKINKDVYTIFHPLHSVKKKKTDGSTHPDKVKQQIKQAQKILKKL
jgi:argininosuccinate lyase